MSSEIHVNDIGTEFRITIKDDGVVVNLTTASLLQIIFEKPDGSILTVSAAFYTDGSDGIIKYNAVSGDLDQAGLYKIQANIEIGSSRYKSSHSSFKVYCNIGD